MGAPAGMYVCGPTPELSSTFSMKPSVSSPHPGCARAPSIHVSKSVFRLARRMQGYQQSPCRYSMYRANFRLWTVASFL